MSPVALLYALVNERAQKSLSLAVYSVSSGSSSGDAQDWEGLHRANDNEQETVTLTEFGPQVSWVIGAMDITPDSAAAGP